MGKINFFLVSSLLLLLSISLTWADPKTQKKLSEKPLVLMIPWDDNQHSVMFDKHMNRIGNDEWKSLRNSNFEEEHILIVTLQNGKKGYADVAGEWIFPPTFDEARTFTEDSIARVKRDDKWGFIRPDGSFLLKPTMHYVSYFNDGIALVRETADSNFYLINTDGKKPFANSFSNAGEFANNGLAYSWAGKHIPVYKVTSTKTTQTQRIQDKRWGYIDMKGKWVIPAQYFSAHKFNSFGIARVENIHEQSIIIDATGKQVGEAYDYIGAFSQSGYAKVKSNDFQGLINTRGERVWEVDISSISSEYNGLYNTGHTFYDSNGNIVIKEESLFAMNFYEAEVTIALRDAKWGILSRNGNFNIFPNNIIAPPQEPESTLRGFDDGLVAMINDNKEIEYFNRDGFVKYRFAPTEQGTMALFNAKNENVWQSPAKNQTYKYHSDFVVDDSVFRDSRDNGVGILETVDLLLNSQPRRFHIPNPIYRDNQNPYNLDGEISSEVSKGAIKIIAEKYIDKQRSFHFIAENDYRGFESIYKRLIQIINKRYGQSIEAETSSDWVTWNVDTKKIILSWLSDSGGYDHYNQIVLIVMPLEN